jgi:hypothetical protein
VLYACGNLLPTQLEIEKNVTEWCGINTSQQPRMKSILTNDQLLAIINFHRILCARKPSVHQQAILKALSGPQSRLLFEPDVLSANNNEVNPSNAQFIRKVA